MEQEEYTKEEIDWSYIEFVDNQDILDLIEKVRHIQGLIPPTSWLITSTKYLVMQIIIEIIQRCTCYNKIKK